VKVNNLKRVLFLINIPTLFLVLDLLANWYFNWQTNPAKQVSPFTQYQMILQASFCLIYFPLTFLVFKYFSKNLQSTFQSWESEKQNLVARLHEIKSFTSQVFESSSTAAGSMDVTVASLEELNSMVQLNSEHAKQAASLSHSSRDTAENGEREITQLIQSMKEISDSSKKVQEITYLIDDISFQTNLLALNAAVEAARAGEQGRGFAVVADAVRNLAQKSAVAAKDIASLINDTTLKVDKGFSMANNSGEVLKKILTSVKMVSDLNNEISLASQEQTVGLNQISKAMNVIDQSLQTNSSTMKDLTAKVDELQNLSVAENVVEKKIVMEAPVTVTKKVETPKLEATITPIKTQAPENKKPTKTVLSATATKPTSPTKVKTKVNNVVELKPVAKVDTPAEEKPKVVKADVKTKKTQEVTTATPSAASPVVAVAPQKPLSKAAQMIPFDEDLDRTKLSKAEDF
jgi:hypothetical protein